MKNAPPKPLTPSFLALMILLLGFLVTTLLFGVLITPYWGIPRPFYFYATCGVCAYALAMFSPLEKWWRLILLIFPLAIYLVSSWQVPSLIYMLGFILCASLFWSTYRTQVPFYPSGRRAWEAISNYLPQNQSLRVIEIGSGLGNFSIKLAMQKPLLQVSGIEIAPLPWLISFIRGKLTGSSVYFALGNYEHLDFSRYDIIFAYLSPAAMPQLWKKVSAEMTEGSVLISHEFLIPGVEIDEVLRAGADVPNSYVYKICNKQKTAGQITKE